MSTYPIGLVYSDQQVRTITLMPTAATSYLIAASNPNRKGFYIYNQSSNTIYVTFGAVSDSASPTFIIPTFTSVSMLGPTVWTGQIAAIRNSGTGATLAAVVTELL